MYILNIPILMFHINIQLETRYKNDRVTFEIQNLLVDPETKEKLWSTWSVNQKVPVYFNPDNNSESVIIRCLLTKRKNHYIALFLAGVLCIAVSVTLLIIQA